MAEKKVEMLRIGRTVLLKGGDGEIKAAVVQGHDDKTDIERTKNFGIKVDIDALKAFIGVTETPKKSASKRSKAKETEENSPSE